MGEQTWWREGGEVRAGVAGVRWLLPRRAGVGLSSLPARFTECQALGLGGTGLGLLGSNLGSEDLDLEGWVKIFVRSGRVNEPVDRQWKAT